MKYVFASIAAFGGLVWWMLNGEPEFTDTVLHHEPVRSADGLERGKPVARVTYDPAVSSDGDGSLRIEASDAALVDLYRVYGDETDLSFRRLVYEAKVRTEEVAGPVYLVMQADVTSGPGSMPVVGREASIQGTTDWTTLHASAGNGAGTRLMESKLQLHIDGPGTVWIDDIRLLSRQIH